MKLDTLRAMRQHRKSYSSSLLKCPRCFHVSLFLAEKKGNTYTFKCYHCKAEFTAKADSAFDAYADICAKEVDKNDDRGWIELP